MKLESKLHKIREQCFNVNFLPDEILQWIAKENLWNIWVPKNYGGLEMSFSAGLKTLKHLAKVDGSLGWTITLCSGANYFIGNLKESIAKEIFLNSEGSVCLGGSGGVFGKAEMLEDEKYRISGNWNYATGAPYLTHFTLNAEIWHQGKQLQNEDGTPKVLSFILPKKDVKTIEDWNTMGLKASATQSFTVKNAIIDKTYSFIYDEFYLPQDIFKIPFSLFADLTLWVNYIGMAEHFLEEAKNIRAIDLLKNLEKLISNANIEVTQKSENIENIIRQEKLISEAFKSEVHNIAAASVKDITKEIIQVYPYLGIDASREDHPLNLIFRDYFTATQHYNFTRAENKCNFN